MNATAAALQPQIHAKELTFRKVLFATDFSDSSMVALPHLAGIVRHFGARAYVAHVFMPVWYPGGPPPASSIHPLDPSAGPLGAKFASLMGRPELAELHAQAIVAEGPIAENIRKIIAQNDVDLLVLGTKGEAGHHKLVLGSATEELVRTVSCPVLSVGPTVNVRSTVPRKILFPANFSAQSEKAAALATGLARAYDAALTVLHVLPERPKRRAESAAWNTSVKERIEKLSGWEEAAVHGRTILETGDVVQSITRAQFLEQTDLVVMGIHARKVPFTPTWRQSIGYRVMARAHCPVLSIAVDGAGG
jgi:nucleotide-binding universal stress UspA family protein